MVNFAIFLNNLDEIRDLFKDSLWSGEKVKINKTQTERYIINKRKCKFIFKLMNAKIM